MKNGLLVINLGTPDAPDVTHVRRYLREFLADPRVIDLPTPLRYLLLYGFILPFRPKISARAYQAIWTTQGSPLLINSQKLVAKLAQHLGPSYQVALGMRYGNPSIVSALQTLATCDTITVLPLYPQYSEAATASSLEVVLRFIAGLTTIPSLHIIRDFHAHPRFIAALAAVIRPHIAGHDLLLLSYHGVPERHIARTCEARCKSRCTPQAMADNPACYKGQCYRTSALLAAALNLSNQQYTVSFQSRLGKTPWIQPFTDTLLPELIHRGIRRLAIACPSFVADCLETLEEIGIQAQQQWLMLGGTQLTLIPCLNDTDMWVEAIVDITKG